MTARARLVFVFAIFVFAGLATAPAALAAPGDLLWTKTWNRTPASGIAGVKVAASGRGDIYVAATIDRGSGHWNDWLLVRYTKAGVRKWVRYYDGPAHGDDYLAAVAADRFGNVVLCGQAVSSAANGSDFTVVRFSRSGALQWAKRVNGSADSIDRANDVEVDGAGNAYVAGFWSTAANSSDWLTIKYSPAGKRLWRRTLDANAHLGDQAKALTRDAAGNVYVTGSATYSPATLTDLLVVRYSSGGHADWVKGDGVFGAWNDQGLAVAVNGALVAVAGITTAGSDQDALLSVFARSDGRLLASLGEGQGAPAGRLFAYSCVGIDTIGNIGVAGFAQYSVATGPAYYRAWYPVFTDPHSAYDDGSASSFDIANDLVMTPGGIYYVTGTVRNTGSKADVLTVAIGPGWLNRFTVPWDSAAGADDEGHALALSGGGLFVAGVSQDDLMLQKYVP